MENLQEATENICRLKGELTALQAIVAAIMRTMSPDLIERVRSEYGTEIEIARAAMTNSDRISDHVIEGLDTMDVALTHLLSASPHR